MKPAPKVSVIIPAYNVEEYIGQCLESILNQTYKDFEVVIVDDGSNDRTVEIIEQYQNKNSNISLLRQKNSGQSIARNKGLSVAKGEYIVYIDSDDWLASDDALEKLVNAIITSDADFVQASFEFVKGDIKTPTRIVEKAPVTAPQILIDSITVNNIYTSPWAKIYKTDFLKNNNLYFIEGLVNEDTAMSILMGAKAQKVAFLPDIVYSSREREGSTSRSSFVRMFDTMHKVLTITRNDLTELGVMNEEVTTLFNARYVRSMLYNILQTAQRNNYSQFKSDYDFCIKSTSYLEYLPYGKYLPLPHRLLSMLSRNGRMIYSFARLLKAFGFKMH